MTQKTEVYPSKETWKPKMFIYLDKKIKYCFKYCLKYCLIHVFLLSPNYLVYFQFYPQDNPKANL